MDETRNDAPLTGEAPQTAKPQPLRRVGSFTLGVCLIAAGIFFLLAYFVPGFDWKLTLKIAPAAGLILLGGEVLFFAARPGRIRRKKAPFPARKECFLCSALMYPDPRLPAP